MWKIVHPASSAVRSTGRATVLSRATTTVTVYLILKKRIRSEGVATDRWTVKVRCLFTNQIVVSCLRSAMLPDQSLYLICQLVVKGESDSAAVRRRHKIGYQRRRRRRLRRWRSLMMRRARREITCPTANLHHLDGSLDIVTVRIVD